MACGSSNRNLKVVSKSTFWHLLQVPPRREVQTGYRVLLLISENTVWLLLQVHLEQMPKGALGYHRGEKSKRASAFCLMLSESFFRHLLQVHKVRQIHACPKPSKQEKKRVNTAFENSVSKLCLKCAWETASENSERTQRVIMPCKESTPGQTATLACERRLQKQGATIMTWFFNYMTKNK